MRAAVLGSILYRLSMRRLRFPESRNESFEVCRCSGTACYRASDVGRAHAQAHDWQRLFWLWLVKVVAATWTREVALTQPRDEACRVKRVAALQSVRIVDGVEANGTGVVVIVGHTSEHDRA